MSNPKVDQTATQSPIPDYYCLLLAKILEGLSWEVISDEERELVTYLQDKGWVSLGQSPRGFGGSPVIKRIK